MFNELLIKQHGKIVRSRPVRSRCRFFLVNKQTNVRSRPLEMPIYYKMRLNFKRSSRELHLRNLCCTLPEDVDFVSTRCNKLYCKTQPVQKCLLYIDLIDYFRCKNTYFLQAFCVLGNSCLCLQLFRELNQAVLASFFDVYQVVRFTLLLYLSEFASLRITVATHIRITYCGRILRDSVARWKFSFPLKNRKQSIQFIPNLKKNQVISKMYNKIRNISLWRCRNVKLGKICV